MKQTKNREDDEKWSNNSSSQQCSAKEDRKTGKEKLCQLAEDALAHIMARV